MAAPCQVDFYVLAGAAQSAQRLACRQAMKAWDQGFMVSVRTEDDRQAKALDELMWDYPPGRFLPPGAGSEGAASPVNIGTDQQDIPADRDVIINLAASAVPEPARFRRLLEIVPSEAAQRDASRNKYRQYREQGLDPAHHTIGKS